MTSSHITSRPTDTPAESLDKLRTLRAIYAAKAADPNRGVYYRQLVEGTDRRIAALAAA